MALPLVTVNVSIAFGDGALPETAILRFTPSAVDVSGDDVLLPQYFEGTITDGVASVDVYPTSAGRGITYLVEVLLAAPVGAIYPSKAKHTLAQRLQIPEGAGPFDLADLMNLDALPPISETTLTQMAVLRDETVAAAETIGTLAELDAIAAEATGAAASAEAARVYADASASAARSARDAAFVNANVFADIATGRAAVAAGQQFQVVTGDEIIRYRRDSSSTQTEVARYPAGQTVVALDGARGQLAAILGQTYEEVDRLSAAQEGDVYTLRTLLEMISVVGQLADQINGGQVALRGGSLADPALRIGTAGIYSSAADTLSVAIAGVERLRVTASGITVYGTVTEA
jgi:hypothetical protein